MVAPNLIEIPGSLDAASGDVVDGSAVTTDSFVSVISKSNPSGYMGIGSIVNLGLNGITVRETVTDKFGTSLSVLTAVATGSSYQLSLQSNFLAGGVTAFPPFTDYVVEVKSAIAGLGTLYELHFIDLTPGSGGSGGGGGASVTLDQARANGATFSGGDVYWDNARKAVFGKADGEADQDYLQVYSDKTNHLQVFDSTKDGTGTVRAMSWQMAGSEKMRLLSTGEFLVGATALTTSELALFEKNQNAGTVVRVHNSTSGTLSKAAFSAFSNVASTEFGHTSATFTTIGGIVANEGYILANNGAASFAVSTVGAIPIRFLTTSIERARLLATGELLIGATALVSDEMLNVTRTGNSQTAIRISNQSAGALARAQYLARGNTSECGIGHTGSGYTTADGILANEAYFITNLQSASLALATAGNIPLRLLTQGIERARFLGTGEFIYGATTLTGTEKVKLVGNTLIQGNLNVSTSFSFDATGQILTLGAAGTGLATMLMDSRGADPAPAAGQLAIYAKTTSGVPQLWVMNGNDNLPYQISPPSASTGWAQGGNAFGALGVIGTTDNFAFSFLADGKEYMRIVDEANLNWTGPRLKIAHTDAAFYQNADIISIKKDLGDQLCVTMQNTNSNPATPAGSTFVLADDTGTKLGGINIMNSNWPVGVDGVNPGEYCCIAFGGPAVYGTQTSEDVRFIANEIQWAHWDYSATTFILDGGNLFVPSGIITAVNTGAQLWIGDTTETLSGAGGAARFGKNGLYSFRFDDTGGTAGVTVKSGTNRWATVDIESGASSGNANAGAWMRIINKDAKTGWFTIPESGYTTDYVAKANFLTIAGSAGVGIRFNVNAVNDSGFSIGTDQTMHQYGSFQTFNIFPEGGDGVGNIGDGTHRWALVRAVTITSGDLELEDKDFDSRWTIREAKVEGEDKDTLYAINRRTGKKFKMLLQEVA